MKIPMDSYENSNVISYWIPVKIPMDSCDTSFVISYGILWKFLLKILWYFIKIAVESYENTYGNPNGILL